MRLTKIVAWVMSAEDEKRDFEALYMGIRNTAIKARIKSAGEWYIEKAVLYKVFFLWHIKHCYAFNRYYKYGNARELDIYTSGNAYMFRNSCIILFSINFFKMQG